MKPNIEREINNGKQKLFFFNNNYGASIVKHDFSYGHELGLWELSVISTKDNWKSWNIDYSTEITTDVIGNLTVSDAKQILIKIEKLPKMNLEEVQYMDKK